MTLTLAQVWVGFKATARIWLALVLDRRLGVQYQPCISCYEADIVLALAAEAGDRQFITWVLENNKQ